MRNKLLSILAHDLKTPFTSIIGLSDLLNTKIDTLHKEKVEEFARQIYITSENTFGLLNNHLEWARLQRNVITSIPKEANLSCLVIESLSHLIEYANYKLITIQNEVYEDQMVIVDTYQINTVLRNLLSNAIKLTKDQGCILISSKTIKN